MAKNPPQNPQDLRDLKAGLDRDGEPRTWEEVATIRGITALYARRVATRKAITYQPPVWIDPREVIPQLQDILSDEDVLRWRSQPRCLCGCGDRVLQEVGNRARVPRGAYRLFRGSHEKRMPWMKIILEGQNKNPDRRRRIGLSHRRQNVQTGIIMDLLKEWRIASGKTFGELALVAGVHPNHLRDIAAGKQDRVRKVTAGKILAALGEPMRPEIYQQYQRWAQAQGRSCEHIRVTQ